MSLIPEDTLTMNDLFTWYKMQSDLATLKRAENLMRMRVFRHLFPVPVEGTNSLELDKLPMFAQAPEQLGYVLKATHKIQRDLDIAALTALTPKFQEAKLPLAELVKYEPSLVLKAYRKLTDEERQLFEEALIIKPGSPSLEIVLPAAKKKA